MGVFFCLGEGGDESGFMPSPWGLRARVLGLRDRNKTENLNAAVPVAGTLYYITQSLPL